ncbi:permease [Bacteroidales bacterium]|nr:permease [Bacteroidales bacterium]
MIFNERLNADLRIISKVINHDYKKSIIWLILILLAADTLYSTWYGINMHTRERCIIYQFMPKWLFMTYEYLIELFMVVIAGTFAGAVTEKYFTKFKRFMPKNQITAFLYASVIPVCSCSAIPLIESMKKKLPFRSVISFVVAAPILNPYVIFISFSVLGFQYGIYRILGALILSILVGLLVELAYKTGNKKDIGVYQSCAPKACSTKSGNDIYSKTWDMISRIAPYIFIAGLLGPLLEMAGPVQFIQNLPLSDNWSTLLIITLIGTFIYLCNGADVLFLAPLLQYTNLGLGNAIAFSITSTAICASSIVLLVKFLGKRLTTILVVSIYAITVLFSKLI